MHHSVLVNEVLEIFSPSPGENYIDATVNGGGHALAISEKIKPNGILLGIDRDCGLVESLQAKVNSLKIQNVRLACDNFVNIGAIGGKYHLAKVDGILFDIGFSSYHIEESQRGFSFLRDEPLDMRYNQLDRGLTAADILEKWTELEIESILRKYGEERFSKKIAKAIVSERTKKPIKKTSDLVGIVKMVVPRRYVAGKTHFATRTFQALRIAVNDELAFFEKALRMAFEMLAGRGKLVVISFHSLEDRIVKTAFREFKSKKQAILINKKVITARQDELMQNPRARSAKLRAIQKL